MIDISNFCSVMTGVFPPYLSIHISLSCSIKSLKQSSVLLCKGLDVSYVLKAYD